MRRNLQRLVGAVHFGFLAVPPVFQKGRGLPTCRRVANRRIVRIYWFDYHRCPNVSVQVRRSLVRRNLQRFVGAVHLVPGCSTCFQKGRGWPNVRRVANHRIVRNYWFDYHRCPNVSVHPRRTLCAVEVQRLVGCSLFI